jgi:hypothetical protein
MLSRESFLRKVIFSAVVVGGETPYFDHLLPTTLEAWGTARVRQETRKRERYVPPYNLALVFAGLGETEAALHWLQQAFEDRDVHMTFLRDHKWDGMRRNAQFQKAIERVGLTGTYRFIG